MTLATAVADYVKARTEADTAPMWARLMREGIVCARMQELLAACYAANETLVDALIDHAPDYVRAQAERWRETAARIPVPPHVCVYRIEHAPPRPQHGERALHGAAVIIVGDGRWYVWEVRGANATQVTTGDGGLRGATEFVDSHLDGYVLTERRPSGIEGEHFDAAVEQALRVAAEPVKKPVKEPEPIVVLGPWHVIPGWSAARLSKGQGAAAMFVHGDGRWEAWSGGRYVNSGIGDKDDAEAWARKYGWVLLDAKPLAQPRALGPWVEKSHPLRPTRTLRERFVSPVVFFASVVVDGDGWRVYTTASKRCAHGPQTGPEGERLAMAAAYALGFVEGT